MQPYVVQLILIACLYAVAISAQLMLNKPNSSGRRVIIIELSILLSGVLLCFMVAGPHLAEEKNYLAIFICISYLLIMSWIFYRWKRHPESLSDASYKKTPIVLTLLVITVVSFSLLRPAIVIPNELSIAISLVLIAALSIAIIKYRKK